MLEQIKGFSLENKIVDFVKISENLSHYNLQAKQCIRLWDNLKKKLKDWQKRENEFQALCRNEVNLDFWSESMHMFKNRNEKYEKVFKTTPDIRISLESSVEMSAQLPDPIESF